MNPIVLFSTVANSLEAQTLAKLLIEKRLAACVNIIPNISSVYRWEGKIETSQEFLLMIKTTKEKFQDISNEWSNHHSYDVPELIELSIQNGNPDYINWILKNVQNQ